MGIIMGYSSGRHARFVAFATTVALLFTVSVAGGQEGGGAPAEKDPATPPPAAEDDPAGDDGHAHGDEECTLRSSGSKSHLDEFGSCINVTAAISEPPSVGDVVDVTMDIRSDVERDDAEVSIELSDNLEFVGRPAGTDEVVGPSAVGPGDVSKLEGRRDLEEGGRDRLVARVRATEPGPATIHLRTVAEAPYGADAGADDLFFTVGSPDGPAAAMGFAAPMQGGTERADRTAAAPAEPAPSEPPPPPMAGSPEVLPTATSCATGTWHFTDNDGVMRPNRNYQVQVLNAAASNAVLAVGVTGHNGNYNVCYDGNVTTSIRVRFVSENSRWRVRDNATNNNNIVNTTGAVTNCNGCTHNFGALLPNNDVHRGMHAFYATNTFWNWKPGGPNGCWDARDALAACRQVVINWTATSTDGTYYSLANNTVHLAANDPNAPHVVIHEVAHAVMDDVYEDDYPPFPNCNPHFVQSTSSTGCAWTEGFAEWVPAQVLADPFFRFPSGGFINLETPTWGTGGWDTGDAVEGRVAGAMIDISDSANEAFWDVWTEWGTAAGLQWETFLDHRSATFNQFFLTHRAAKGYNTSHSGARSSVYQNTIDYSFRNPLGNYTPLTRPRPSPNVHNYSFPTTTNYWSAVAIRPPSGADYDLALYENFGMTTFLKSSSFFGNTIDFVAIDSNSGRRALQTYYPRVNPFSGSGNYRVEVAQGSSVCGDGTVMLSFPSTNNVLRICDSFLSSGTPRFFRAVPQATQQVDAFLMRSTGVADAIRSRVDASRTAISGGTGQPVGFSYDTPTSGWHGLVVTNRAGSGGVTLYVDTTPPSGSVAVQDGALVHGEQVTLELSAADGQTGVDLMRVAVDGVIDSEPEEAFTATKQVSLPPGDGIKTIAVQYRNRAGMWSPIFTTTTTLEYRPDMRVTLIGDPPAEAAPGAELAVNDRTRNLGTAAAGKNSRTRYYLTRQRNFTAASRRLPGARIVPNLPAGGTSDGSTVVTVPNNMPLNSYWLAACADDTALVLESDEENNCRWSSTRITIGMPDLVVTAVADPPATAAPGDTFNASDTTQNLGSAQAGASRNRYWLTEARTLDAPSRLLAGVRQIPELAAGGSDAGDRAVTIPANMAPGRYFLMVCADYFEEVAESKEANNCRWSSNRVLVSAQAQSAAAR